MNGWLNIIDILTVYITQDTSDVTLAFDNDKRIQAHKWREWHIKDKETYSNYNKIDF